jgi:hypothetical protein
MSGLLLLSCLHSKARDFSLSTALRAVASLGLLHLEGSRAQCGAPSLLCVVGAAGLPLQVVPPAVELALRSLLRRLSQSEVLCEPFPLLQVAWRAIVPCFVVTMLFLHPTSLAEKSFPILQHYVSPQGLFVLALKPRWLAMSPPVLVEGELRLYQ